MFTLILIFIYRIGSFIVLPGIDPNKLATLTSSTKTGMLGLLDTFVGGAFSKASIFALGIMPYISASIFMQLMTILVPQMAKIQKEGESGRSGSGALSPPGRASASRAIFGDSGRSGLAVSHVTRSARVTFPLPRARLISRRGIPFRDKNIIAKISIIFFLFL